MTPQISTEEQTYADQQKAELATWLNAKETRAYRRGDESTPELIDALLERWAAGEPFYIDAVVVAPYDGCFHEPNIYLCTPPGCDLFDELNRHDVQGDRVVWQLYASGQGMCVDCLVSLTDIVTWMAEQSLSDLATREEGRASEHRRHHYGRFDSFELHDYGPVSSLPASETYWAHAVRAAEEEYGLALPWTCDQCESVLEGTGECMMEPIHTGYSGNGGIGVFMHGAICYDCYSRGSCQICEETCSQPHDIYSPEVAEHGADICDNCAYDLFRGAVYHDDGWDTALDAEDLVRVVTRNGKLVVLYNDEEGTLMEGIHIATPLVDKTLLQWRMGVERVFGGDGKLVLASSLAHMSEETPED